MAFKYGALSAIASKRLIKVRPENGDGVHIKLYEETGDAPYRCLSYTWGEPTPAFPIRINGRTMEVRKSLLEFLIMASKRFANEPLWIDAICINQQDDREKSVQVQRMGIIYKDAFEVLIWLGNDPGIAKFLDWISRPERKLLYLIPRVNKTPWHLRKAVQRCIRHPYWRRAWIMQEVSLARSLRILCSSSEAGPDSFKKYMDWESLLEKTLEEDLLSRFYFFVYKILEKDEPYLFVHLFFEEVQDVQYSHDLDFWGKFKKLTYHSECFDVRDKIYSILSITGEESFQVDYRESVVSMFQRSANHFELWSSPEALAELWSVLELTEERVLEANRTGQYLQCEIPMHQAKVARGIDSSTCPGLVLVRASGCQEDDLLLCSHSHHPFSHVHFTLRQCQNNGAGQFEVLIHSKDVGHFIEPPRHFDTELRYVSNGQERRVVHWDDVVNLNKLQTDAPRDSILKPHFLVKLDQNYLFWILKSAQQT